MTTTARAYRTTLRWSCDTCGLEQTIKTGNKGFATSMKQTAHERPCVDPECRENGGKVRMPVKLVECDHCSTKTARVVKGGAGKLKGKSFCSHACRGAELDELETVTA